MGAALAPLLGMARGDIPSSPIPSRPTHSSPAMLHPWALERPEQGWGSPLLPTSEVSGGVPPCPLPPPALCHRLGPGQRGPWRGGRSPGPGHDLRGDLERVPAAAGDPLCLSSRARTFPCSPQGNSEHRHRGPTVGTTRLELKKNFFFFPSFSDMKTRSLLC